MKKKQYVTMELNYIQMQADDIVRTSADVVVDADKLYGDDGWIED